MQSTASSLRVSGNPMISATMGLIAGMSSGCGSMTWPFSQTHDTAEARDSFEPEGGTPTIPGMCADNWSINAGPLAASSMRTRPTCLWARLRSTIAAAVRVKLSFSRRMASSHTRPSTVLPHTPAAT